jgi:hypothetical protein
MHNIQGELTSDNIWFRILAERESPPKISKLPTPWLITSAIHSRGFLVPEVA